jgi:NTE family protein
MSSLIETRMSPVVDMPIDFNDLNDRILRLNGLGRFSSVTYQFIEKDGRPGLELYTEEKPYAPPLVQPLLLIDGSSYNNAQFNLGARVTFLDVGGFHSELRNDIILLSEYGLNSEYYHPFKPTSQWFIAPRGNADDAPFYIYSEKTQIATYRQRTAGGGVDVGRVFGNTSEVRAGYEGGWQKYSRQSGSPTLPIFSGAFGDLRLQYKMDRLDEAVLPRQGHYFQGDFKWANVSPIAPNRYPVLEGASLNFYKLNEPSSVFVHGWGGTTFNYATGIPQFSLGGSVRMLAYGQNELLVDKYFMGQGGYQYRFAKLPPLVGDGMYGIGLIEGGKVYGTLPPGLGKLPNLPGDIAAAVVVKSLFGPVEFGYAYGTTGHHKFFFRIGRLF